VSNWSYPANAIPRPNPGCPAEIASCKFVVIAVTPTGATLTLRSLTEPSMVRKARRVRVRVPRELGPEDVSPVYRSKNRLGAPCTILLAP